MATKDISTFTKQMSCSSPFLGVYGGIPYYGITTGKLSALCEQGSTNPCDFHGVYVVYRDDGEIIYVGAAYKSTVGERLQNHISGSLKNSSFAKKMAKEMFGIEKSLSKDQKKELGDKIGNYNVFVFNCTDLETILIDELQPYYNQITGNKKPRAQKTGKSQRASQAAKQTSAQTSNGTQPTP